MLNFEEQTTLCGNFYMFAYLVLFDNLVACRTFPWERKMSLISSYKHWFPFIPGKNIYYSLIFARGIANMLPTHIIRWVVVCEFKKVSLPPHFLVFLTLF